MANITETKTRRKKLFRLDKLVVEALTAKSLKARTKAFLAVTNIILHLKTPQTGLVIAQLAATSEYIGESCGNEASIYLLKAYVADAAGGNVHTFSIQGVQ